MSPRVSALLVMLALGALLLGLLYFDVLNSEANL